MATFNDKELQYLRGQRLGRLATADAGGSPHVVPVGFRVSEDGDAIEVGGHGFARSKKYRDVRANPRVAIVIDDLASVSPWTPRGIEIRGRAETSPTGGEGSGGRGFDPEVIRIWPDRVRAWGIDDT